MNTLNHHRIISSLGLDSNTAKIFEEASDFTDDLCKDAGEIELKSNFVDIEELRHLKVKLNEDNYFYYHFYYDIEYEEKQCNEGKITLSRSKRDENKTDATIGKCTLGEKESKFKKTHIVVDHSPDPKIIEPSDIPLTAEDSYDGKKEFFTLINGREKYLKSGLLESSNQSDCVAFLHAMAAKEEESEQDKLLFKDCDEDIGIKRLIEKNKQSYSIILDRFQKGLSVAGYLPGIGAGPDLINAAIYLARGEKMEATISLISAMPVVGDISGKAGKVAKDVIEKAASKDITKYFSTEFMGKAIVDISKDGASKGFEEARRILEGDQNIHDEKQSRNVVSTARIVFEEHLKKCFAEYLFLNEEEEALFILGIAFHGIMDSFTPSHTTFQKYNYQNFTLHAQGDVIPIRPKEAKDNNISIDLFDPGEADAEEWVTGGKSTVMSFLKGYNGRLYLNSFEYKMLWIYFLISDIAPVNNEVSPPTSRELSMDEINLLWKTFEGYSLDKINSILKDGYNYGNRAWVYADNAIQVMSEIYTHLHSAKHTEQGPQNYSTYLENKNNIIEEAINIWRKIYDDMYKDEEFKRRQNLLRLIFKEDSGKENNLIIRATDLYRKKMEVENTLVNKFMVWSGDTLDSIVNKGKSTLDDIANYSAKSVTLFPHGGANKA